MAKRETTPRAANDETASAVTHLPANLRAIRNGAGLTLEQLAARAGVSRAMISKIERGASVPTTTVLGKLAAALNVSLSQLLGDPRPREPRLNRHADQVVFRDAAAGFHRRSLSPLFADRGLDMAFITMPPGGAAVFAPHHAGVEEYIAVHAGTLTVVVGEKRFAVAAGDALFYPSDCLHEFHNETPEDVAFYIVIDDRAKR